MHTEARYKNLQTDNFVAKTIHADSITLKDNIIKSDVMTSGATIKQLYEAQRNTNAFDDSMKQKLNNAIERVRDTVTLPHTFFKLPLLHDLDQTSIPDQHATMCFDYDGNVVYICKFNGSVKQFTLPVYEPRIQLQLSCDDISSHVSVNLNVV